MNGRYLMLTFILLGFSGTSWSQPKIEKALERYNSNSVEYISVEELVQLKTSHSNVKLLDARAPSEYSISHIQDAIYAGYEDFTLEAIQDKISTRDTLVVYCSIGVRSEDIGEKLQNAGYEHVFNLYGGIFEWVNQNQTVYNQNEEPTLKIHAYDLFWSKYLKRGQKVF